MAVSIWWRIDQSDTIAIHFINEFGIIQEADQSSIIEPGGFLQVSLRHPW